MKCVAILLVLLAVEKQTLSTNSTPFLSPTSPLSTSSTPFSPLVLLPLQTLSTALEKVNEDLRVEMAQKDILHRIEQSGTGEDGIEVTEENAILMEKYRSAQRELEGLRLRLSSEHEEDLESLQTAKRNLDKKVCVCVCAYVRVFVRTCMCMTVCMVCVRESSR